MYASILQLSQEMYILLNSMQLSPPVSTLQKNVEQYYAIVVELEKLLPTTSRQAAREDADTLLRSIPATMQNMSDLFKFASAKLAALHERVEALKDGCLDTLQAVSFSPILASMSVCSLIS